jgi:hypothetical protein
MPACGEHRGVHQLPQESKETGTQGLRNSLHFVSVISADPTSAAYTEQETAH